MSVKSVSNMLKNHPKLSQKAPSIKIDEEEDDDYHIMSVQKNNNHNTTTSKPQSLSSLSEQAVSQRTGESS
jgi:hypothetical protein